MRISIRKHNRPYLDRLAAQMETDSTEAINYLLTELRRVGYSFNSGVTLTVGGLESGRFTDPDRATEPQTKPKELGSTGSLMAAVSKDPVIERILTAGLEVF
jgi:hypothetical protein